MTRCGTKCLQRSYDTAIGTTRSYARELAQGAPTVQLDANYPEFSDFTRACDDQVARFEGLIAAADQGVPLETLRERYPEPEFDELLSNISDAREFTADMEQALAPESRTWHDQAGPAPGEGAGYYEQAIRHLEALKPKWQGRSQTLAVGIDAVIENFKNNRQAARIEEGTLPGANGPAAPWSNAGRRIDYDPPHDLEAQAAAERVKADHDRRVSAANRAVNDAFVDHQRGQSWLDRYQQGVLVASAGMSVAGIKDALQFNAPEVKAAEERLQSALTKRDAAMVEADYRFGDGRTIEETRSDLDATGDARVVAEAVLAMVPTESAY